jgi:hypothetical protein
MLRRLWDRWKGIAHAIGTFQSRVLLTVFYCLIVLPFGLGLRLLADPLRLRCRPGSHWRGRATVSPDGEHARRQF